MTPAVLSECLSALSELYPTPPMTEQRAKLYRRFLMELSDEEIRRGTARYIREAGRGEPGKTFLRFPAVGELLDLARPLPTDTELVPIFRGIEQLNRWSPEGYYIAASEVERKYGPVARIAFLASGGDAVWQRMDVKDSRPFVMKRFFEAHREAEKGHEELRALGPVPPRVQEIVDSVTETMRLPKPKDAV